MGKLIDLTGQKFGRLTVLSKTSKRNSSGQVYWKCLCDCGKECEICGVALRNGHTKSCGCYNLEKTAERGKNRLIDLTGQKFGKLTVLRREGNHVQPGGQRKTTWLCKCECGNEYIVTGDALKSGRTKSCGCIKKSYGEDLIEKILKENNIPFSMEQSFDNCILPSGKKARFDFYIIDKCLIEFDGKQHFDPEAGWDENIGEIQKRDSLKNEYCLKNNIPLYRIPYTAVDSLKTINDILNEKYLINKM